MGFSFQTKALYGVFTLLFSSWFLWNLLHYLDDSQMSTGSALFLYLLVPLLAVPLGTGWYVLMTFSPGPAGEDDDLSLGL